MTDTSAYKTDHIDKIFIDLDDVLNSFTLWVLSEVFKCGITPFDYDKYPIEAGYEIEEALRILRGDKEKLPPPQFWNAVTREIWANAPRSRECDSILAHCELLVGRENIYIATSPTKCPEAHAGKIEWITNNLPEWLHRQYFITPRKWILAKSGSLLIDDCEKNCKLFEDNSGKSLLVPRPWNIFKDVPNTKIWLEERFNLLYIFQ